MPDKGVQTSEGRAGASESGKSNLVSKIFSLLQETENHFHLTRKYHPFLFAEQRGSRLPRQATDTQLPNEAAAPPCNDSASATMGHARTYSISTVSWLVFFLQRL